jgi:FKBP-type peptidyl-prolyl cis-trans isomerase 2
MILSLNMEKDGETHQVPATVLSVDDDTVTVDYNHPLAGQVVVYNVTLIAIHN